MKKLCKSFKYNRLILYKKSFVIMQQYTKNIETPSEAKIIRYDDSKKIERSCY